MSTIHILLADDHAVLRDGLCVLLQAESDMRVVATAANGREAVQKARQQQPNVVVMDIGMPELNGIDATRQILELLPQTRVVILSIHSTAEHVRRALEAGALGYLLKESAGSEVVAAVRAVYAGKHYLSSSVNEVVLGGFIMEQKAKDPLTTLSDRERDVLQLIVEGKGTARVAEILSISPRSVETYRSRIMQKLEIHDLPSLVKFAIKHGLIALD